MERNLRTLLDCKEFHFWISYETFDALFLHLEFKEWSPKAYKKFLWNWRMFLQLYLSDSVPFYAVANHNNDKVFDKFVKRLGFTDFKPIPCPDGKTRPCYILRNNKNG